MRLYIGGAYQGQEEIARRENPGAPLVTDLHARVRAALARGEDARETARRMIEETPDAVIVCDEVGMGIVPISPEDRAFREALGRALCVLAASSDRVTRAVCGIPQRIK